MPGPLLTADAKVHCMHGGIATPMAPNPRVLVNGTPTLVLTTTYQITACLNNVAGSPVPCVEAQWKVAATHVTSGGSPVVLLDSQAICLPNGTPLLVEPSQTRVIAT